MSPSDIQDMAVLYLFSVCGACLLWAKTTIQRKKAFGFGDIIERLIPNSKASQYIIQFLVFVLFGGLIGLVLAGPDTARQAIAGGIAWSRISKSNG